MSQGKAGVLSDLTPEAALLRARVAADPGCADFPVLADAERRAGRLDEAFEVAEKGLRATPDRLAGRVALGLILLDQGELDAARRELALIFESGINPAEGPSGGASPASPELGSESTDRPRGKSKGTSGTRVARVELPVGEGSAFRTRTMARLLESQGDVGRAEAILDGLNPPSATPPATPPAVPSAAPSAALETRAVTEGTASPDKEGEGNAPRVSGSDEEAVETLERWLRNVQREHS